ncbi:hypothetical protein [Kocuria palustris]|uniref:hypothetical protein n=1 Tax=Kocuria palustris TaxID=71999 RepID=UPI003324504B
MTSSSDPHEPSNPVPAIFLIRAENALLEAGLSEADPRPLAQWAADQVAQHPRDERAVGVLVCADGAVLTQTSSDRRSGTDPFLVPIGDEQVSLRFALPMIAQDLGRAVAHVRSYQVCEGSAVRHPDSQLHIGSQD